MPAELFDLAVTKLLPMLLYIAAAFVLVRLGRRMLARFQSRMQAEDTNAGRSLHRSAPLATVLGSLLTAVVWTVAVLQILTDVFGLKIAPIITGAGIVGGVALGFGAQSLVRDFLTGFFVLLEDQYRVGDRVEIQGVIGTVERFTLRATSVRSPDGTLHHIANGTIERSANNSAGWSRALVDIAVDQGEPMEKVRDALMQAGMGLVATPRSVPWSWSRRPSGEEFTDSQMQVRVAIKTAPGRMRPVAGVPAAGEGGLRAGGGGDLDADGPHPAGRALCLER
ncbi:MAG: mechanosensitive ion channel family protein [Actinomycetota bacterium]